MQSPFALGSARSPLTAPRPRRPGCRWSRSIGPGLPSTWTRPQTWRAGSSWATLRDLAVALDGIGEVEPGDDLAEMIAAALAAAGIGLEAGDILVVTQKVVSKAEGRVVELASVTPRAEAVEWAERWGKDARQVELVLQESAEVLRMAPGGLIISRTRHGFVCANAGVDLSNVGGREAATLLPVDSDASAGRCATASGADRDAPGCRHQRLVRAAVAKRDRERCDRGGGAPRAAARPARDHRTPTVG